MKQIFIILLLIVGIYAVSAQVKNPNTKVDSTSKTVEQYSCPMHPEIKSDKPGKCPECGMALVKSAAGGTSTRVDSSAKTFACPMHADATSNKADSCPKCGMKMTEAGATKNGKKKGIMACCMKS